MRRVIYILLITAIFCGMFTGCYDRREIDEQAYVIAIGLDKGKTNRLKMTLQIAVPRAIGGSGGGGGGGDDPKKAVDIVTLECPTLYSGLNMANSFVSRQLNISHAKVIIFSKELAQEGLERLIFGLPRGREFRPNIYVAISTNSAEEYIKAVEPTLEVNPAKYYELIFSGNKYTGFTANSQFHKFYLQQKANYQSAVAILAGKNRYKSSDEFSFTSSTIEEKGRHQPLEGDFKAGDITRDSKNKSEIMGLAVFNGPKMVGELDGEETTYHLMIMGEYKRAYMTQHDPIDKDKFVILDVKQSRKHQQSVKMVNGKPVIDLDIKLEADILVIQSGINYEAPEKTRILEMAYEQNIKEGMLKLLNKTAKEYHADICGFGNHMKSKFLTWKEWEDFKWLDKYKDASFNVEVDVKIRRPGLLVRSSPIRMSDEGGKTQ